MTMTSTLVQGKWNNIDSWMFSYIVGQVILYMSYMVWLYKDTTWQKLEY